MDPHDEDPAQSGNSDDADSDLEELQGDIAKFDESVRQFLATHHEAGDTGYSGRGGPRGRGARGPRKAAKPRGDITARLAKVNQAFLSGDYDRALDLAFEVIRINAETHQAWTALSSTFAEIGDTSKALSAMVYAAHLRPKDVSGWLRSASYALDTVGDDEDANLHTARLCYSAALRADPTNLEARTGKASVCQRQGHLGTAVTEYGRILKRRPGDIDMVRRLAEACMDARHAETAVPTAITAYQRYFTITRKKKSDQLPISELWYDVGVYVEMFAYTGRYGEAIRELKSLARWLVGRGEETFWDSWQDDDREWDIDDARRSQMPEAFTADSLEAAGRTETLPLDLRARLAIYRFRVAQPHEALHQLGILQSDQQATVFTDDFPYLAFDLASGLAQYGFNAEAVKFLEPLRAMPGEPDPAVLLQLGRCNLGLGNSSAAEECFLSAIDADEMSIEPRIELASMYESAKEGEEALILAAEAMAIRDAQAYGNALSGPQDLTNATNEYAARLRAEGPRRLTTTADGRARPMIPRRYRPKRLADPSKRRQEEQAHAFKLAQQYEIVSDMKRKIAAGEKELIPSWMSSAKDLIDDFRSLKRFYTWDRYLKFLGPKATEEGAETGPGAENDLSRLYQRLARNVAPPEERGNRTDATSASETHQGITFDQWLELFLDHAIALAMEHRQDEAYHVCESARDSTVFQSAEHSFSIHVAWSVCAIYTSDEGKAITIARHLMRDMTSSDGSRMYALLANLCQSPISWYTSGPAQKFILRQIKLIDSNQDTDARSEEEGTEEGVVEASGKTSESGLDICLLMLYGHILFTSTSYTFALGYFLRARSIDPDNPMINLSLGLAYVHYGLKRQSANRQYILLQGQAFLAKYASVEGQGPGGLGSAESNYNIGRIFHLLGISHLAVEYYSKALEAAQGHEEDKDTAQMTMVNYVNLLMAVKNKSLALALTKKNLVL